MSEQAREFRKDQQMKIASAYDSQDQRAYDEAIRRHYCGEIINKDIDLMIYAQSLISTMFEIVPVEGTNIPAYTLWTLPDVPVTRMSAHGEAPAITKYRSGTQYFPTLYLVSSGRIYQPNASILTGEQGPVPEINAQARYEIQQVIEDDMWTLVNAACGAFTAASTWVYDTRIQNMPTTNEYDFSSEGGLTVGLFRKIMETVDLIPSRSRPGQSARIRNIIVPHVSAHEIREWVSVVSNVAAGASGSSNDNQTIVTPEMHRQIETQGPMIDSMYGENVGIIRYNRLTSVSAANFAKYLHVVLDEPIGRFYVRPEEDRTTVLDDHQPYETGYVSARMVGMEIPDTYKPNFFRVQYAA
jgi:hypothetical protein